MPVLEEVRGQEAGLEIYTGLTRRQLKNEDLFICEGIKAIETALEYRYEPVSLLLEKRHAAGKAAGLVSRLSEIPVYTPPDEEIKQITGIELSRGVLCAMKRKPLPPLGTVLASVQHIAVLETVNDDSNIGAIFRNAAALGIDAVILTKDCADPLSRKSVRVSMGAVFRIPFAFIDELSGNGIAFLKHLGFTCAALALDQDSISLKDLHCEKCAFLLGSEGNGLKPSTLAACDCKVMIPMHSGMDSLNVAAASAIAFYSLQK